jgi:hypothetical protein
MPITATNVRIRGNRGRRQMSAPVSGHDRARPRRLLRADCVAKVVLRPLRQIKERGSLNMLFKFIKRPNAAYLDSDRPLHRTDGDFLRAEPCALQYQQATARS